MVGGPEHAPVLEVKLDVGVVRRHEVDATLVTFTIYDSTGKNQLWQDSVSSNIPNTAGREFGIRIGAWQTTTSAAAVIVYFDWVKVEVPDYN
ncbi:MAG: hypothetical protein QXE31_02240 [Candidatus Woesearchaeota archaeon]